MTDVGVAVTNLRVVYKIITCVSAFTDRNSGDTKLLQVWTLCVAGYAKDTIVGARHRTSDGQEHKIIWLAGPERDTIFHLHVTACREQSSHCRDVRLAWVSSRWQGSFVSKVLGANYKKANNFLQVAVKFAMCADRK